MANIKTAKKMILVHERRRKRNVSVRTRVKNVFKSALAKVSAGEAKAEELQNSLSAAASAIFSRSRVE